MNRQSILSLSAALVVALLASSCNKSENEQLVRDGKIRVKAAMQTQTKSLATVFPLNGFRFFKMDAAASPSTFVGAESSLADIAAAGDVTFATPLNYNPSAGQKAWLVGFYPAGDLAVDKLTWTIDGKTDILCQTALFDAGDVNTPVPTGLTFTHLLSRVEVVLLADPKVDETLTLLQARWGKVEKIEIVSCAGKVSVPLSAPFTQEGSLYSDQLLLAPDYQTALTPFEVPANNNKAVNAAAMVLPVRDAGTPNWTLRITFTGGTLGNRTITTNFAPTGIQASKIHKATLTVTSDQIYVKATVAEWITQTEDHVL